MLDNLIYGFVTGFGIVVAAYFALLIYGERKFEQTMRSRAAARRTARAAFEARLRDR